MNLLRVLGEDLLKASIQAQGALWPGTEPNKNIQDLAADLQGTETRVREWRHSLDRAGADEALAWVLSWHEGIDLNLLVEQRRGSFWIEDPKHVKMR